MNATESILKQLASEFNQAFERGTRNDGTEFYSLKDGSPRWMTDAIHEAHGDILPNDWIYDKCDSIADNMSDTDPADWEDSVSEWADGLVDVYNADRTAWLASHLAFGAAVDEAVEELGHSDQGVFGDIGVGQYRMIEQIAYAMIRGVQSQADEQADDDSND